MSSTERFHTIGSKFGSWTILLIGIMFTGCYQATPNFVPTQEIAQLSLSRALETWRDGGAAGEIAGSKPMIFVTDSNRKETQRLIAFRILGETPGLSGRTYAVELEVANPSERLKAEYIVVGIDPLWVFRREDYELLMHWDHHMSEKYESEKKK
jgi:hypothetical protein